MILTARPRAEQVYFLGQRILQTGKSIFICHVRYMLKIIWVWAVLYQVTDENAAADDDDSDGACSNENDNVGDQFDLANDNLDDGDDSDDSINVSPYDSDGDSDNDGDAYDVVSQNSGRLEMALYFLSAVISGRLVSTDC